MKQLPLLGKKDAALWVKYWKDAGLFEKWVGNYQLCFNIVLYTYKYEPLQIRAELVMLPRHLCRMNDRRTMTRSSESDCHISEWAIEPLFYYPSDSHHAQCLGMKSAAWSMSKKTILDKLTWQAVQRQRLVLRDLDITHIWFFGTWDCPTDQHKRSCSLAFAPKGSHLISRPLILFINGFWSWTPIPPSSGWKILHGKVSNGLSRDLAEDHLHATAW